jgi:hypothetical protein
MQKLHIHDLLVKCGGGSHLPFSAHTFSGEENPKETNFSPHFINTTNSVHANNNIVSALALVFLPATRRILVHARDEARTQQPPREVRCLAL